MPKRFYETTGDLIETSHIEQYVEEKTAPSVWLGRQALINESVLRHDWHDYLDELGHVNRGKGHAHALGSMALTFVSAKDMGRLVQDKYPKIQDNRPKLKQVVNRIAKDYSNFVRVQSRDVVQNEIEEMLYNNYATKDDYTFNAEDIDIDPRAWGPTTFDFNEYGYFGKTGLGIRINSDLLDYERNETMQYLKLEKFNTKLIQPHPRDAQSAFKPHVVVFNTFNPIEQVNLRVPARAPELILLDKPHAVPC
jgi:hypothetical protein